MGSPIHAVGQESLHDFIRVTKENYCGEGNHYAGLLILFDEFGRYLEFSVQNLTLRALALCSNSSNVSRQMKMQ